jgi:hypothetical protein
VLPRGSRPAFHLPWLAFGMAAALGTVDIFSNGIRMKASAGVCSPSADNKPLSSRNGREVGVRAFRHATSFWTHPTPAFASITEGR